MRTALHGRPWGRRWGTRLAAVVWAAAVGGAAGTSSAWAGSLLLGDESRLQYFDSHTGAVQSIGGIMLTPGINGPGALRALTYGPDGNLYICDGSATTSQVWRYDTGFLNTSGLFVPNGSGGLNYPTSLAFGPDGNLYVASGNSNQVLRYSGRTGYFIDAFVPAGSGGLAHPQSLVFGPDGNLYVASAGTNQVLRYNGTTGAFIDAFVAAGSGGLSFPAYLLFGPDGRLYVSSANSNQVLRYDGTSGAFIDAFVAAGSGGLAAPASLAFGPDGNLYVGSSYTNRVLRYNGSTGAFIDIFITTNYSTHSALASFTPPRVPTNANAYLGTASQVLVSWNLMSDDETGVEVWRNGGGADWTRIAALPARSRGFADNNLLPGAPYKYRVRTVNNYGVSAWTFDIFTVATSLVPDPPDGFGARASGPGTIVITWEPHSGAPVTGWSLWRKGGGADWAPLATLTAAVTSYVDTGLAANTQYTYRVRSFNTVAASVDWSREASAWTPIVPPPTPSSLTATVASPTQVNLAWSLTPGDETAVVLWRKTGAGAWTQLAVLPPHTTSYSDTGLTAGTLYTYRVVTNNDFYVSGWSNPATATPS